MVEVWLFCSGTSVSLSADPEKKKSSHVRPAYKTNLTRCQNKAHSIPFLRDNAVEQRRTSSHGQFFMHVHMTGEALLYDFSAGFLERLIRPRSPSASALQLTSCTVSLFLPLSSDTLTSLASISFRIAFTHYLSDQISLLFTPSTATTYPGTTLAAAARYCSPWRP